MKLNSLKPAKGSRKKAQRVGRGPGSGCGKTCKRGQKGQKSRSGGYHKVGFEGGQMPIQRRLPKVGFRSRKSLFSSEVRLHELNKVEGDIINLETLRAANIITSGIKFVKIILKGELKKAVNIAKSIGVSKGAKAAIEVQGGKVQEA